MDQEEFHFLSEVFPVDERLSTIDDLRIYFADLIELVEEKFPDQSEETRDEDTTNILEGYNIDGLDVEDLIGDALKTIDRVNHDEKLICVKTMLIIYHYVIIRDENSVKIRPFICYIEEKILPKVFDCAKMLKKQAQNGIVEQFETGLESMENWQLIILHLYIRLQVGNFTDTEFMKHDESFSHSFLVVLTVLKYFSERKQKFVKENHGIQWKIENFDLLNDHLLFWPYLRKLLKPSFFLEPEEQIYINYVRDLFGNCSNVFIECIYILCDFNPTSPQKIVTNQARTILTKTVNSSTNCWNRFISLLKEDYNEVKNVDDFTIISNEKSRNYGTTAHVIKFQILSTLGYALEHDGYIHEDNSAFEAAKRYHVLLHFKDFIIENMNRKDTTCDDQTAIRDVAIIASLGYASLRLDDLIEPPTNDFLELISCTFQKWKEYLVSNQSEKRRIIISTLILLFTKRKCSDDLLQAILDAYQINRPNFVPYSELLRIASKFFYNINEMNNKTLESFKQVITNAFETFVKNDTLEYFSNEKYIDEETKSMIHTENTMACLSMMDELYFIHKDNNQIEQTLSVIKHKCADLFMKKEDCEENDKLIFCFVCSITEIVRKTEKTVLLTVLEKLNYYPFLTRFIRFIFSEFKIDYSEDIISDIGALPILIGQLCNTGIIFNCPYDDNQDEKEKDFLYDFLLPKIIDIVILPISFIANAKTLVEEQESTFMGVVRSCWTLGRILHNDITRNGGEKSLAILDKRLGKILKIIELIRLLDYESMSEYMDQLLITIMLFIRKRMNLAPQIMNHRARIYSLCSHEEIERNEKMQLCYCIFEFVEFMFDNGYLNVADNEVDWIEDIEEYLSDYPLFLKTLGQRIIEKIKIEMDDQGSGEEE